ncbi:hypothetical protein CR513_22589, partial [Mucuna pruriens]
FKNYTSTPFLYGSCLLQKHPRKLNLNAPFLSLMCLSSSFVVGDTSFSSKLVGAIQNIRTASRKPTDTKKTNNTKDEITPRLRLLPQLAIKATKSHANDGDDAFHDQGDDNCDNNGKMDDYFLNAMNVFSLIEPLDNVQKKYVNAQ